MGYPRFKYEDLPTPYRFNHMRKQKVANSFLKTISKTPECVIKAEPNQTKTKTNHLEEASSEELLLKTIASDRICF